MVLAPDLIPGLPGYESYKFPQGLPDEHLFQTSDDALYPSMDMASAPCDPWILSEHQAIDPQLLQIQPALYSQSLSATPATKEEDPEPIASGLQQRMNSLEERLTKSKEQELKLVISSLE